MSALAHLTLTAATRILTPEEAARELATRGDWSAVCQQVAQHINGSPVGTALRFDDIGLTADVFKRAKASKTHKVGDLDYSGITNAARAFGLVVRRTVDDSRAFVVPADQAGMIDKVKRQRAKAARKAADKKAGK